MPLQIPHPNNALHLYRHLLREATYLPALCRPWITSRIKARYRDCEHEKYPKRYIKDAHHHLRNFRSANDGNVKRMLRLCYMATGRAGKRRRLLGKTELSSDPPTTSAELDEKTILANVDEQQYRDWVDNWDMEKVKAIALSQAERSEKDLPYHMRRTIDPRKAIPTENSFGRPLSKKLARNKLKKHWAQILRQLLPPLPKGEWDQLGTLARGEADPQYYKLPKRRPVAQLIAQDDPQSDHLPFWADLVTKPMRMIERPNSRKMKSLSGGEDEDPRGHGRKIGVRVLNQRKLRRGIYLPVWEASPIVDKNPRSGKWLVTWGNHQTKVSRPRKKDLQFFQGVNEVGLPIRSAPTRKDT
ncbi:uncharacterized protein GGS22DRAFT_83307 [Annulohypoxylon maeteangense]|uniref:uncharacterized protein n=1 Tax=Annulohypoxylon maeteangense TaxID=1927788 RepID=UPI0020073EAF|nr:uncharacterized protein GGS22DRAFT_83307 [Annulohypoxylon maeteangense]KAI0880583.1 hypothetical protein GGS22DRAFT_83307 [Annulohypoxylon maeteangense]